MKLTQVQARGLAADGCWIELGLEVVLNEQTGSRRWVSEHVLVVKDANGDYWETTYEQGLTECQDTRPFEDVSEVEFYRVERVPVMTYEYQPFKTVEVCAIGVAEPVAIYRGGKVERDEA